MDRLRVREKAHTHEGDAIAAARRRLPMVEVDASTPLTGPSGQIALLEAFEGRRQLVVYYFMWHPGHPAAEQCEGCTYYTTQVSELSALHSRDITFAVFCQGPYDESARYHDFMGWNMLWYSAQAASLDTLLAGREPNRMYIMSYLRDGSRVFETYWTTIRGVEAMDNSYALMDLTAYGRQEAWEDSPDGSSRKTSAATASSPSIQPRPGHAVSSPRTRPLPVADVPDGTRPEGTFMSQRRMGPPPHAEDPSTRLTSRAASRLISWSRFFRKRSGGAMSCSQTCRYQDTVRAPRAECDCLSVPGRAGRGNRRERLRRSSRSGRRG